MLFTSLFSSDLNVLHSFLLLFYTKLGEEPMSRGRSGVIAIQAHKTQIALLLMQVARKYKSSLIFFYDINLKKLVCS